MTSFFRPAISAGIFLIAEGFAAVIQAAVPNVSAEAAPAVTSAPSHFNFVARYWLAAFCSASRRTGCFAASATAACTWGGMMLAVRKVYVPAALIILVTPSLS